MKKNILITGGGGFIGFHLAKYHAKNGDNIILLDNLVKNNQKLDSDLKSLMEHENIDLIQVDLANGTIDLSIPDEIDVVYHLAAINGTNLFYEIPYEVCRNNVIITTSLLDSLRKKTIKKLVYSSSSEVYSGAEKYGLVPIPTSEDVPVVFPQPTDTRYSYGTSKFIGEFLCSHFGKKYNTPVSIIRFHNIYGPRMGYRHVIPEFIKRVFDNVNPFYMHGGDNTRAFCFVDDAVKAISAVANSKYSDQEIIHIGKEEEIKISNLANLIMKLMNKHFKLIEKGSPSASVPRRCPNTKKLYDLTGYKATTRLEDGLKITLDWYLHDLNRLK